VIVLKKFRAKRIVDFRDNAQKKLQQKESDIVKPLMEKLELQYKSRKAKGFQYVLDGSTLLLAEVQTWLLM
jgi:outer membrane protein